MFSFSIVSNSVYICLSKILPVISKYTNVSRFLGAKNDNKSTRHNKSVRIEVCYPGNSPFKTLPLKLSEGILEHM